MELSIVAESLFLVDINDNFILTAYQYVKMHIFDWNYDKSIFVFVSNWQYGKAEKWSQTTSVADNAGFEATLR
jgi:hypothetical protein